MKKHKLSLSKQGIVDANNSLNSPRKIVAHIDLSKDSDSDGGATDSSTGTIIYSLTPGTPKKSFLKPSSSSLSSPSSSFKLSQSPGSKRSSGSSVKLSQSPSSRNKYFSPIKKRCVTKKSPNKTPLKAPAIATASRRLFERNIEDALISDLHDGIDDKTLFFLNMIQDILKEQALRQLLDEESCSLLSYLENIPSTSIKLVCRLFWRKEGWFKCSEIGQILSGKNMEPTIFDQPTLIASLQPLEKYKILIPGTKENLTIAEYSKILKLEDLKDICKFLKLKTQTKKNAVECLNDYCSRTSTITSYFSAVKDLPDQGNNKSRVLKIMNERAGTCFRLSNLARNTLEKLYILTYLPLDYEIIRDKKLELMLIYDKIQRETFPISKSIKLDDASIIFNRKEDFDSYLHAHFIKEDFLTTAEVDKKCELMRQTHKLYHEIDDEHMVQYKSLASWLQRFSPAYIFIRILSSGIQELKKGKVAANCEFAIEVLNTLIGQSFREHRKAEWYAEKALILHSYLDRPEEAAKALLEGFESELTEESKDCMRPRAKKIAFQNNITLDNSLRDGLKVYALKESILESSIPSRHFHKQALENITKGKAMFETKSQHGRVIQGVEEYAISCYVESGEYTNGCHWEGRIVTTLFFLLFFDIIYSKPEAVDGIFLSYFQRFPLDMFSGQFYANRKEAIDNRLKMIEESTEVELLEMLRTSWDDRPESEISGINRDIGCDSVLAVSSCLRARRVGAICRRMARDYRYTHSGFPDLTVWNTLTKEIKFVEVKSDSDKPSMKQIQWMQYLLQNGIGAEFCYVGANSSKPKSRQPMGRPHIKPKKTRAKSSVKAP